VFAGLLLYVEYGTWQMTDLMAAVANGESSLRAQIAAVLLAQAALIKCAQLPLHGWLIQVVEAPTPVSALLHAGVINLGGVLLIMFAPLISQVPVAQWWILIVAGVSTAIAVSVMSVETNVKAQLAWSTSAQMGLMLIECALGLYHLALLHLLAHSCYKAWSFLAAGTRVARPAQRPVSALWVAPVAAVIATTTMVFLPDALGTTMPLSSRTLLAVLLFAVLLEALVSKEPLDLSWLPSRGLAWL
jgi:NADH:ubiquinone oxidoreductase subunit 5 (chain L)/Multisubunit Na+/H+ antiporter, MnhA subunit